MKPPITLVFSSMLLTTGCLDIDFDPPSIVTGARILAISANPPEAIFGEDIRFEALVVDENAADISAEDGVEMRWTICLSLRNVFSSAGLGASVDLEDDCGMGGEDLLVLEHDGPENTAFIDGSVFLELLMSLPMSGPGMPPPDPMIPGVDPEVLATLALVVAEVGIPLRVEVEVRRDGELILLGFKRFALTTRSGATLNPPPPRFSIDEVEMSARGTGDPHVCVPVEGVMPSVEGGAEVELAPYPLEEPWLETYPVFDLAGGLIENQESAYYSWFSTAGAFASDVTQRPERDNTWTAPEEPGTYPMILVVRDGHLGLSWCRTSIEVR